MQLQRPFTGAFFLMKKSSYLNNSLKSIWYLGAAFLLSLCWLLPNNARPWSTFHSDAWIACVLALISLVVFLRTDQEQVEIQLLPLLVLAVSLLPLMQYSTGKLPFSGQAWISTSYLLGFGVAIMAGQQWYRLNPVWMARVLFVAFLLAGVVSVFLALYQWLRLGQSTEPFNIWVLYYSEEQGRPYANMAQPNQLATLFLWALVACGWATTQGYLRTVGGLFTSGFLLIGLALTQSRSAMVGSIILLYMCWKWRHLATKRMFIYFAIGLLVWYVLLLITLPYFGQILLLETQSNFIERSIKESRLHIWKMLFDAAMQQPWTGYGWNQVLPAQLAVSEAYPENIGKYLAQSHNIFLDFIIWSGFPIGLLLSGIVLNWLWLVWRKIQNTDQALYFAIIIVTGVHAMVELPLHYAYFLLPIGLMIGALNADMQIWKLGLMSFRYVLGIWLIAVVLLGFIINDYFRIESAYNDLRFKKANFVNAPEPHIPQAWVLNHLQYAIEMYALEPAPGLAAEGVQRAISTTIFLPSAYNISKLVVVLALNQRPQEAKFWMHKAKTMMTPENYLKTKEAWAAASLQFPEIAETLRIQQ